MTRVWLLLLLATSVSAFLAGARPVAVARRSAELNCRRAAAPLAMAKKKKAAGGSKSGSVSVLLSADVKNLGRKGEVVSVKPAYAENMLVRTGLGQLATPEILAEKEKSNAAAAATAAAAKAKAVEASATLKKAFGEEGGSISKNVGPDGALFGSVTPTEVAQLISQLAGVTVEKKDVIECPDMKAVGSGVAKVRLHKEVVCELKINVVAA